MRTTNVQMSEAAHEQEARQALHRCQEIAEQNGLSSMTMEEINAEIKAARQYIEKKSLSLHQLNQRK